ncbi:hypothetical protein [Bosea sp. 47.2.35]|uniref:hypothetical protein n=1 Tax=Bosea sp. 47.2.35 TaxID=2969304 RepID=UPI00214FC72E|nr:hypothetical protein [Bosea sp. 47.2.35]MCR4521680.1 hypothetical protein [Bosea sp. 47.2.35]
MEDGPYNRIEIAESWAKREITAATAIRLGGFGSVYDLYVLTWQQGIRRMAGPLTRDEEIARDRFFGSLRK